MEQLIEVLRIKQEYQVLSEKYEKYREYQITCPDNVITLVDEVIGYEDREVFLVMCLNNKKRITAIHRCHIGSINASIVSPPEVFKSAILNNSKSIIVAHNHPSGDPSPSREDIQVTQRLKNAGEIIGIGLLDHIIIGFGGKAISLKEKGHC